MDDDIDPSEITKNRNVDPGLEKDSARNIDQTSNQTAGRTASDEDRMVQRLLNRFWRGVTGEELDFRQPDRVNFQSRSRPLPPATTSRRLGEGIQVILEELLYQLVEDNDLVAKRTERFGRFRSGQAAGSAPLDAGQAPMSQSYSGQASREPLGRATPAMAFSDEELGLGRSPLSYSFDDGIAVLSRAIRDHRNDRSRLAAIMTRHFGPLIAQSSAEGSSVSAEKVLDSAISLLAPLARDPGLGAAVIKIVPSLRHILGGGLVQEHQGDKFGLLSVGEIQSLAGLATLAAMAIDAISRAVDYEPWAVIYNHEILRMIAALPQRVKDLDPVNLERVLETSANNLAAGIGRMLQNRPNELSRPEVWRTLSRKLVQVSILMADTRSTGSTDDIDTVARLFGIDTTDETGARFAAETWASRLSGQHMVALQERAGDHLFLISLRYVIVGLLRETIGSGRNVASAFFNSGVELIRIKDRNAAEIPLRIIVNGVGILGALRSTRVFDEAMIANDGADCLVNLLGSVVEMSRQSLARLPRREVGRLMTVVETISRAMALLEPGHEIRMSRSIDALKEREVGVSGERLGEEDMAEVVRDLVNAMGRVLGLQIEIAAGAKIVEMAPFLLEAYAACLPAFADQLPKGETAKAVMGTYLTDFVRDMMAGPDDPYEVLREAYAEVVTSTGETISAMGPLRAIGLMDKAQWDKACQAALGLDQMDGIEAVVLDAFSRVQSVSQPAARPLTPTAGPEEETAVSDDLLTLLAENEDHPLSELARRDPKTARLVLEQMLRQAETGRTQDPEAEEKAP